MSERSPEPEPADRSPDLRLAFRGSSGAGKTTLARWASEALGIPHIELDALNWDPEWRDLSSEDLPEFRRRVASAIGRPEWTSCGNYSRVNDLVLGAATHLVWIDYSRARVMYQVIGRSFSRALDGRELWPGTGNRESFRRWLDPEHPIRWAWNTFDRRREQIPELIASEPFRHLRLEHLRSPRDARTLVERLARSRVA